jgi:hypothetical protein
MILLRCPIPIHATNYSSRQNSIVSATDEKRGDYRILGERNPVAEIQEQYRNTRLQSALPRRYRGHRPAGQATVIPPGPSHASA